MSWIVRGEWWYAQAGAGKPPSADFAAYEAFVRQPAQNLTHPEEIEHVAKARQLIAARPSLGPIEIHVNENSTPLTEGLPGWEAGWVGALEDADVDRANRSCWVITDPDGSGTNGCYGGGPSNETYATLDQLFNVDGSTRAVYWVRRFYADMTGTRVAASVAAPPVPIQGDDQVEHLPVFRRDPTDGSFYASAFAARDDASHTVRALVGRHHSCTRDGTTPCAPTVQNDEGSRPPAPTLHGRADVTWPYGTGSVLVTIDEIPNVTPGTVAAPTPVSTTPATATSGGTIAVDFGQVADGEAFTVTVAPAGAALPARAPLPSLTQAVMHR